MYTFIPQSIHISLADTTIMSSISMDTTSFGQCVHATLGFM
jgi:hypothetical protein